MYLCDPRGIFGERISVGKLSEYLTFNAGRIARSINFSLFEVLRSSLAKFFRDVIVIRFCISRT